MMVKSLWVRADQSWNHSQSECGLGYMRDCVGVNGLPVCVLAKTSSMLTSRQVVIKGWSPCVVVQQQPWLCRGDWSARAFCQHVVLVDICGHVQASVCDAKRSGKVHGIYKQIHCCICSQFVLAEFITPHAGERNAFKEWSLWHSIYKRNTTAYLLTLSLHVCSRCHTQSKQAQYDCVFVHVVIACLLTLSHKI